MLPSSDQICKNSQPYKKIDLCSKYRENKLQEFTKPL